MRWSPTGEVKRFQGVSMAYQSRMVEPFLGGFYRGSLPSERSNHLVV